MDRDDEIMLDNYAICKTRRGYAQLTISKNEQHLLHRFLLDAPRHMMVDHINGNTLDNRRTNLRLVTPAQNQWNRRRNSTHKSTRYKGVCVTKTGMFLARITHNREQKYLGSFMTAEAARTAYVIAESRLRWPYVRQ
jgi:hypothetical protein